LGMVSLGTTLRDVLSRQLFSGGLSGLLDTGVSSRAWSKRRYRSRSASASLLVQKSVADPLANSYGIYFRELLLDMPYATALRPERSATLRIVATLVPLPVRPTSADTGADRGPGATASSAAVTLPSLRDALTNSAAIAAYQDDPFNPYADRATAPRHAPARGRHALTSTTCSTGATACSPNSPWSRSTRRRCCTCWPSTSSVRARPDIGDCGEGGVNPRNLRTDRTAGPRTRDRRNSWLSSNWSRAAGRSYYTGRNGPFRKLYDLRLEESTRGDVGGGARSPRSRARGADAGAGTCRRGHVRGPGRARPGARRCGARGRHPLPASGLGSIIRPVDRRRRACSLTNGPVNPGNIDPAGPSLQGGFFGNETLIPVDFRLPPRRVSAALTQRPPHRHAAIRARHRPSRPGRDAHPHLLRATQRRPAGVLGPRRGPPAQDPQLHGHYRREPPPVAVRGPRSTPLLMARLRAAGPVAGRTPLAARGNGQRAALPVHHPD